MSAIIRKIVTVVEETHLEMGQKVAPPTRRPTSASSIRRRRARSSTPRATTSGVGFRSWLDSQRRTCTHRMPRPPRPWRPRACASVRLIRRRWSISRSRARRRSPRTRRSSFLVESGQGTFDTPAKRRDSCRANGCWRRCCSHARRRRSACGSTGRSARTVPRTHARRDLCSASWRSRWPTCRRS